MSSSGAWKVVITRAAKQAKELVDLLEKGGIETLLAPVLKIAPVADPKLVPEIFGNLQKCCFDWLIFSSPNAVRCFFDLQKQEGMSDGLPSSLLVAAVGAKTAAVCSELYQRPPDLVPEKFTGESLVHSLSEKSAAGKFFLYPTARQTTGVIEEGLKKLGANLQKVVIYETVENRISEEVLENLKSADPQNLIFTFFSPSAVKFTLSQAGDLPEVLGQAKIVSIGPTTSRAIRKEGLEITAEAKESSVEEITKTCLEIAC